MLNIERIELHFSLPSICMPSVYLPHTCDSWLEREDATIIETILRNLIGQMWTRSYETHISEKHIYELREFIEMKFS